MTEVKSIHTMVQFESLVQRQQTQQRTEATALLKMSVSIGYPSSIFCEYILYQKGLPSTECQGMDVSFSLLLPLQSWCLSPFSSHPSLTEPLLMSSAPYLWLFCGYGEIPETKQYILIGKKNSLISAL